MLELGIICPSSSNWSLLSIWSLRNQVIGIHVETTALSTIALSLIIIPSYTYRTSPVHSIAKLSSANLISLESITRFPWNRPTFPKLLSQPLLGSLSFLRPTKCCTNLPTFYRSGATLITFQLCLHQRPPYRMCQPRGTQTPSAISIPMPSAIPSGLIESILEKCAFRSATRIGL